MTLRWADLAADRPELAAAGEDLFRAFTVGYLATVRPDGAPRVHPITVTLYDGGLFVSTVAGTRKAADLARDGRYALHSFPRLPDGDGWSDEEFMVGGRAREVRDPSRRAAVLAVHNDAVAPGDPLWELTIDRALWKHRVEGRTIHETWRPALPAGPRPRGAKPGDAPAEVGAPRVRPMVSGDWPEVERIYREGIATGVATLDAQPPDWERWDAGHRADCRFVAEAGEDVVGWIALSPYSPRPVYSGVAWESVYVAEAARGRGVGRRLLEHLIPASEGVGIWTLLAGIQAENRASLALHRAAGFRRIGMHRRLGRDRDGRWRDVVLMERRSEKVGPR